MDVKEYVMEGMRRLMFPFLVGMGDLTALYLSLGVSFYIRMHILESWIPFPFDQKVADWAVRIWIPLLVIGVFLWEGLYARRLPFWEETQQSVKAIALGFLGILAVVSLGKLSPVVSRSILLGMGVLSMLTIPMIRFWWKPFLHRRGIGIKKAIIVGEDAMSRLVLQGLQRDHYMGFRVVGWVSVIPVKNLAGDGDYPDANGSSRIGSATLSGSVVPYLGDLSGLDDLAKKERVRGAFVVTPGLRGIEQSKVLATLQRHILSIYVIPNMGQVPLMNSELLYLFYEEMFLLGLHNRLKSRFNRFIKDVFDYMACLLLLIVLMPMMAAIWILIRATSPGPAIFRQSRIGQDRKIFRIYKFRSMKIDAEEDLKRLLENDTELKKDFEENQKIKGDPRTTQIGRFLRSSSLDELPQVFNVLWGDMSLVGPRPVTEKELIDKYREAGDDYALVKPGITGLWQVSGRSLQGYETRVRLDRWYIQNWSLWLDIVILVRTIGVVIRREGAY